MLKELINFVKFSETGKIPQELSMELFLEQISSIENELDHKLLNRIDGTNFITNFGKNFLPYAQKCISAIYEGVNVASERSIYDLDNYLVLAIARDSASTWAMNCIRSFNRLHPGLRVSIIADDNFTDDMAEKSTIIFWCLDKELPNYDKIWYVEYKYGLYASDDYIEKHGIPTLDNIQNHKIIAYSGSENIDITNWHLTGNYGLPKLTASVFSQSRDLIAKMTAEGVGIGAIADRQDVYYGYQHLNRVLKIIDGPSMNSYFFVKKGLSAQMICNVDLLSGLFRNYFLTRGIEIHMV